MLENVRELFQYRALLFSLIGRDLKGRYRGSVFGFLWTFLNPVLQMLVYSVVFHVYLGNGIDHYPYFLFVGLLPWNWLATSLLTGVSSISDRRDLITKVKFPPQILPMTVIGSALANYLLTLPLMLAFGFANGIHYGLVVVAFPIVVAVQLLVTTGIVYFVASVNVTFRDLQHILGNLVMFAFFLTPIMYSADQIPEQFRRLELLLNPAAVLVRSYQDIFYSGAWPNFRALGRTAVLGALLFIGGSLFMGTKREDFAEFA